MAINEKIVTGRKFRRLIDKDSKLWQLISWWTKASDVEFDDGKTAEQKLGNINGITSDFSTNNDKIAASSVLTKELYDNMGGVRLGYDEDGNPGFIITDEDGADTVCPFSNCEFDDNKIVISGGLSYHSNETCGHSSVSSFNMTLPRKFVSIDVTAKYALGGSSTPPTNARGSVHILDTDGNVLDRIRGSLNGSSATWNYEDYKDTPPVKIVASAPTTYCHQLRYTITIYLK